MCSQTNFCSNCQNGTLMPSSGTCQLPCMDPNCANCNMNSSVCQLCNNFYTLINGACTTCQIDGCATCNATNFCVTCAMNYQLFNSSCLFCSIFQCATCSSSNNCIQCNSNYLLVNNTCQAQSCAVANCSGCL